VNVSQLVSKLVSKLVPQAVFLSILNQAAYIAGKANKVKAVATINPPMIAIAIGPQNTLRDKGIIANTAAAAVKMIGL
jgi:hypothetical protein